MSKHPAREIDHTLTGKRERHKEAVFAILTHTIRRTQKKKLEF